MRRAEKRASRRTRRLVHSRQLLGRTAAWASGTRSWNAWRNVRTLRAGGRIVGTSGLAFEERALLDRERLMINIALDVTGRLQGNFFAANGSHDLTADDDLFGNNAARNPGLFTDQHVGAVNIALDLALNMDFALGDQVAHNREIGTDHRCNSALV